MQSRVFDDHGKLMPADLVKSRARAKRYRTANSERVRLARRRQYVRNLHGVTLEAYEAMMDRRCDWCSEPFTARRTDSYWCSWDCRKKVLALRRSYGMNPDDLRACLAAQGFRCAGCGQPITMDDRHIDHDHATEQLRGILCVPCNMTLGNARDDVHRLRGLATYLERS